MTDWRIVPAEATDLPPVFARALGLHIIETTENGTGYRAFDPPHPRPNYAAWLILILMIGGGIWSALT